MFVKLNTKFCLTKKHEYMANKIVFPKIMIFFEFGRQVGERAENKEKL